MKANAITRFRGVVVFLTGCLTVAAGLQANAAATIFMESEFQGKPVEIRSGELMKLYNVVLEPVR